MARGTWGTTGDIHPLDVRISFRLGTSTCVTGFTLRDASLTPSNPQSCAAEVADWVNDSFRTLFLTTDSFLGVDVLDMTTGEGGGFSFANLTGTQAPSAAQIVPSFLCATVGLKGELRRRYGQGRMFWPVRYESWVTGELLDASGVTAFQGVIDELANRYLGTAGSTDYVLINAHGVIPPRPGTPTSPPRPEVPASWYDVTTIRLNQVITFLRSRKAGVGS